MGGKMIVAIPKQPRDMGRPKKTNATKRSYRFDNLNMAMLEIYAERHCMDITTAMNFLLRQVLTGQGLMDEGRNRLAEKEASHD
jgi:hypothetical protein